MNDEAGKFFMTLILGVVMGAGVASFMTWRFALKLERHMVSLREWSLDRAGEAQEQRR